MQFKNINERHCKVVCPSFFKLSLILKWTNTVDIKEINCTVPHSSSKFNPKDSEKTSKRWLFLVFLDFWVVFLGFWAQKPKNTIKSHRKLMSFWRLFRLNFEDEGALGHVFLRKISSNCLLCDATVTSLALALTQHCTCAYCHCTDTALFGAPKFFWKIWPTSFDGIFLTLFLYNKNKNTFCTRTLVTDD